jgi:hypothetical protein
VAWRGWAVAVIGAALISRVGLEAAPDIRSVPWYGVKGCES